MIEMASRSAGKDTLPLAFCLWANALEATAPAKKFMDELVAKYGQD